MLESIVTVTVSEIAKKIIGIVSEKIKLSDFNNVKKDINYFKEKFPELYELHYNEIQNWASLIPFKGLNTAKDTKAHSIELQIASEIIKVSKNDSKRVSEEDLLNSKKNIILIGAPGAGKTTTLKRLVNKYLNQASSFPNSGFPILIRLRTIDPDKNLLVHFLETFGILYSEKELVSEKLVKKYDKRSKEYVTHKIIENKIEIFVSEDYAVNFISKFLNATNCLLMLDGLDEVEKSRQLETLKIIESIGLKLSTGKIMVTVRKSELNKEINGFVTYEISPLNEIQIEQIATKWLGASDIFINELKTKPYQDLANRPIFLTLLLIIYQKSFVLPNQPSDVYSDATYLVLKEWDEHRNIIRQSQYSQFNTRKKIKFLSELSYHLTYKTKQKVFNSADLEIIYNKIYQKYNLPQEEIKNVVSELESHTGILTESSYRKFEFSHLSIQEYLCAFHIVNLPFSQRIIDYFFEYPDPLAIAVCISADPSDWLSNLILNKELNITNYKMQIDKYESSIFIFLNRLLSESPNFNVTDELGFTFIYIIDNFEIKTKFKHIIQCWLSNEIILKSLASALKKCSFSYDLNNKYIFKREKVVQTSQLIEIPTHFELQSHIIDLLLFNNLIKLFRNSVL